MRIAFVHEYLNQFGGAERMLLALCAIFPDAPIYTLFYDANATGGVFEGRDVRTSFLQNLPFVKKHHRGFPLLMPLAVEQFDFSDFDAVISISASFAKGVITKPHTKHICICLTPPRFLWDDSQKFVEEFGYPKLIRNILPPFISYLRVWDKEASCRVDEFWAISDFIRQRIKKYYGRESELVYPPIDISKFPKPTTYNLQPTTYFLMAGRLVAYKRFDLGVKAFNKLGFPLKIVGIGPEFKKLKRIANDNIEFLGLVSDDRLADLYSKTQALIFPQEEDFGIVPLEAMASGRPVIAFRSGGAVETTVENKTGAFFDEQTVDSLAYAVKNFDSSKFDSENCRKQAERFDVGVFKTKVFEKLSSL
ncbi:MAG: glycosyltransferase [Candidatus Yanofskybacteria bacterium]|nr:glycosyltransferase [Candidatus Yanofskybacteria bacterium]